MLGLLIQTYLVFLNSTFIMFGEAKKMWTYTTSTTKTNWPQINTLTRTRLHEKWASITDILETCGISRITRNTLAPLLNLMRLWKQGASIINSALCSCHVHRTCDPIAIWFVGLPAARRVRLTSTKADGLRRRLPAGQQVPNGPKCYVMMQLVFVVCTVSTGEKGWGPKSLVRRGQCSQVRSGKLQQGLDSWWASATELYARTHARSPTAVAKLER